MIKLKKWMMNPCEECTHVLSDETGEAVIIDCGAYYPNERRHLLEYIEKEQLRPARLLLTHAHHDHINTLYNPYYKDREDGSRFIQSATAAQYCDRTWDFPYKIDHNDLCFRLFTEAGFEWGGDWTTCKDFQHFELIEQ